MFKTRIVCIASLTLAASACGVQPISASPPRTSQLNRQLCEPLPAPASFAIEDLLLNHLQTAAMYHNACAVLRSRSEAGD